METEKERAKVEQKDAKRITVSKNGPYLVSGGVPVLRQTLVADSEGTALEWRDEAKFPLQEKCGLCRCGHSQNKPYCDGTHAKIGFVGTETADNEPYLDKRKVLDGSAITLDDVEELCASARFCHRAGGIWNIIKDSDNPQMKQTAIEEACDC